VSLALVKHPAIKAVGFTGSLRAGRALYDAAAKREEPIPVYAEMGSVNPVFLLPGALKSKGAAIAEGLFRSVMMGTGQFCTSPGLSFTVGDDGFSEFRDKLVSSFQTAASGTMLNSAICRGYSDKLQEFAHAASVEAHLSGQSADAKKTQAQAGLFITDAQTWLTNHSLHEEIFGPATVAIRCQSPHDFVKAAEALEGNLTATIHGLPEELSDHRNLIAVLSRKVGRLIFNGFPTGVEVGYAMHHGGPYPATTDEKFTSVGATAIYRFARPVCYQNFPDAVLPPELQNRNPRGIWRTIDGRLSHDAV
jgi:NADP-dependent aldehyde dehydrogenase